MLLWETNCLRKVLGVLLKCLSDNEAYLAISETHSGACGAHQAGHKMKWILF